MFDAENTNDLIRIVLPPDLEPLRQRYANPDDYEHLMERTRLRSYHGHENGYEHAAREAQTKSRAPSREVSYD